MHERQTVQIRLIHNTRFFCIVRQAVVFGLLVLLSCAPPLYESARIHRGFTWGGGVGVGSTRGEAWGSTSIFSRYGFSEHFSLGLQAAVGLPEYGEAYLNAKLGMGKRSAWLFGVGVPRMVSVNLLQDLGDVVTIRVGGGGGIAASYVWGFGIDFAADIHPQLTERSRYHITGCVGYGSGALEDDYEGSFVSAGIGIEFLPGAK